ncbi:MAG: stage V sporulation protein AB [Lachnospiraceae bacterium]|nr:stage V sporulation protein AB [Lachnospiraceae bacterium]
MFPAEWAQKILLFVTGVCSGALVAAGMFAFVTMIGVVSRMAASTKTIGRAMLYEDCVVIGATAGNYFFHYAPVFHTSWLGGALQLCFGFFAGIYIGCLSIALAELLNVVPIISRRLKLHRGLTAFVLAFAFGKLLGAAVDFFL